MPRSNISLENWCLHNNCEELLSHLVNDEDKYVSYSSHKKIDWICNLGHKFSIDPCKFTNPNRCRMSLGKFRCPYCNGQKVLIGFNDLDTTNPELSKEWDFSKNDITPQQVTRGSHKEVWWRCKNNHSWKARISARDYRNGCPYCSNVLRTSLPEQILYYYCKKYFPDTQNMYSLYGVAFDICIPSKHIVIEYDGSVWHSRKDTSYKFEYARQYGYILYKITGVVDSNEPNTYYFDDTNLNIGSRNTVFTTILVKFLYEVLGINETLSDYKDAFIFARYQVNRSKITAITLPDNVQFEWSPLNGYNFEYTTNDGYNKLWRCFYGHTFKRRLDVIKRGNITCPFCENKQSFDFLYLGSVNNLSIILDVNTLEIEFLADSFIYHSFEVGLNIQGVKLYNNNLLFSVDYILSMKPTRFRNNFERFKNKYFICKDMNYSFIIDELNKIFNSSLSMEKIHLLLNNFLSRLERI